MIIRAVKRLTRFPTDCRQLRQLLQAGLSLKEGVSIMQDPKGSGTSVVPDSLRDLLPIHEFLPFEDLTQFPNLVEALTEFERYFQTKVDHLRILGQQLSYPALLLAGVFGLVGLQIAWLVPAYIQLFTSLQVPIPLWMEMAHQFKHIVSHYWIECILLLGVLGSVIYIGGKSRLKKWVWAYGFHFQPSDLLWLLGLYIRNGYTPQKAIQRLTCRQNSPLHAQIQTLQTHYEKNQDVTEALSHCITLKSYEKALLKRSVHQDNLAQNMQNIAQQLKETETKSIKRVIQRLQTLLLLMLALLIGALISATMTPITQL